MNLPIFGMVEEGNVGVAPEMGSVSLDVLDLAVPLPAFLHNVYDGGSRLGRRSVHGSVDDVNVLVDHRLATRFGWELGDQIRIVGDIYYTDEGGRG